MMSAAQKIRLAALLQNPALQNALADLPASERIKRFPPFLGVRHALSKTLRWQKAIETAAQIERVPAFLIEAIVFRETLGYGLEDVLLDRIHPNASRGVCQIRPSTALRANAALSLPVLSDRECARALDKPESNIQMCARILFTEIIAMPADPFSLTDEEMFSLFKMYNGGAHYAKCVLAYAKAFAEISLPLEAQKKEDAALQQNGIPLAH